MPTIKNYIRKGSKIMKKNVMVMAALTVILALTLSGCGLVVLGDPTPDAKEGLAAAAKENNSSSIPEGKETLSTTAKEENFISENDAKEIVAEHFSLKLEECRVVKCHLDEGEYEVELVFEGKEYEAEVDARSGKIFDADVEREDRH